jgi:uncharacterized protein YlxW (UPF0749 family)
MQSSHIMVITIVLIVMIASVFRARYGATRSSRRQGHVAHDDAEAQRLREEVKQLKERLAVIERITVEKENSLEREIEKLRDR